MATHIWKELLELAMEHDDGKALKARMKTIPRAYLKAIVSCHVKTCTKSNCVTCIRFRNRVKRIKRKGV